MAAAGKMCFVPLGQQGRYTDCLIFDMLARLLPAHVQAWYLISQQLCIACL